jgi:C4-dicarboxylate-binding protein DctP
MRAGLSLYLVLTLWVIAPVASRAEPVKLRVTLQVPASNPQLGLGVVQFKEEVEREAQQAVQVEIFDRGKLYIDDQVVDAVQSGAIEMGVAAINQFSRRLSATDIMEQPFLFNFDALVHAAVAPDGELRKLIDKAVLETVGVRVLWWQTVGPQVFFSKGMDVLDPVRIKGKKIRVFSETMASFARHCGGTPLILSVTKMHDALKDGTIDMAMTAAPAVETRELWKVADTITRTDHALIEFLVVINEKTWQSLADRHKIIIMEAAKRAERDVRGKSSELEGKAYDFARSKGMKVYELTPDHVAEWRACSSEVLAGYMGNGSDLVRELLTAYGKLRTQPCCSAGTTGAFNQH